MNIITHFMGIEQTHASHIEKWVSALAAMLAIAGLGLSMLWLADNRGAPLLLASMGASAVLLFAMPHGPLSQPWALLGGHLISAFIGVSCAHLPLSLWLTGGLAVGLSVAAMYYLRCIHPPGGATALAAVLGSHATQPLNYSFLLVPVLLNTSFLLLFSLLINNLFAWRRYPLAFHSHQFKEPNTLPLVPEDFAHALNQMDSFVDIEESELLHLYALATQHAQSRTAIAHELLALRPGACYSNGRYGLYWAVRQIESLDPTCDTLHYRTLVGQKRRRRAVCSCAEFQSWASHEVERDEENWKRVNSVYPTT